MKRSKRSHVWSRRNGVIVILTFVLLGVMLAMIAFAVDVGYLMLTRSQLQSAADASALAGASRIGQGDMLTVAQSVATANAVNTKSVKLLAADVQTGSWNPDTRTFTPSTTTVNAVRTTTRTNSSTSGATPLFFARVFGMTSLNQQASAVATVNPRDIAFVVDLSGSMNDDTSPGYPNASASLIQNVYNDFGFGTYSNPGTYQAIGAPLGVSSLSSLSSASGPLSKTTIPVKYRITKSDTAAGRTTKAYSWTMDVQIPAIMPAVVPVPNSANSTSYSYWVSYISAYPSALGYYNYVRFMMVNGRGTKPDGVSYTPLSVNSTSCPYHSETTDGGTFSFPPREMPTHAIRRAIIAALQVVSDRNSGISDANQKDHVSIIVFDQKNTTSDTSHVRVLQSLTTDYSTAMQACRTLQALDDSASCTDTEGGLILAKNHIKAASKGGTGRENVNKVVVLLTDGLPNLYESSTSTISSYISGKSSAYWYSGSSYSQNAALMQTSMVQGDNWYLYPVGVGASGDQTFMNRMACMATTATKEAGFTIASDATTYETTVKTIFSQIITRPKLRLVQ